MSSCWVWVSRRFSTVMILLLIAGFFVISFYFPEGKIKYIFRSYNAVLCIVMSLSLTFKAASNYKRLPTKREFKGESNFTPLDHKGNDFGMLSEYKRSDNPILKSKKEKND